MFLFISLETFSLFFLHFPSFFFFGAGWSCLRKREKGEKERGREKKKK